MQTAQQVHIRPSSLPDVAQIADIYGQYVENSGCTFELTPPSAAELSERRDAVLSAGLPHLVAERDGRVLGFAYASPYRPRPAYRLTLEVTIYVAQPDQGHGIGNALLEQLVTQCATGPWQQMIAVIGDSENAGAIHLYERHGFRHAGVLTGVGQKFGRSFDIVLMQRAVHPEAESRLSS